MKTKLIMGKNWFKRQFSERKLISNKENKVSFIQIMGFVLTFTGVLYLALKVLNPLNIFTDTIPPDHMAVIFFVIMLGVAFSFPKLLEDRSKGLSTMRVAVFMMVNVICLLLLKIGWDPEVKSFADIKIDGYWVGIIAFIFGAKATQTYYESKMAVPQPDKVSEKYQAAEVAKLAVAQHQQDLKTKFPNIASVSDAVHDNDAAESTHVVAIYLKDSNRVGIPEKLQVKMPDDTVRVIDTEVVCNVGQGEIHISQSETNLADKNNPKYLGSVCCAVRSTVDESFMGVLTSAHILSHGYYNEDGNGVIDNPELFPALLDGTEAGNWFYKRLTYDQDLAVIKLKEGLILSDKYKSFHNKYHQVSDKDVKTIKPNITIISKDNNIRDAYILDYGIGIMVKYKNGEFYKKNVILIGSSNNRSESVPVSVPGDSGSCVYHKDNGMLIGMLLGGDSRFTYVLPIHKTLESKNYKTI